MYNHTNGNYTYQFIKWHIKTPFNLIILYIEYIKRIKKKMSTLHHESLLETCFEEALEEIGISEDSPFYADAYKTAQVIAMDKFLGMAQ